MAKDALFSEARKIVVHNLEAIQRSLVRCVEEGMLDPDSYFYNELLGFLADASIVKGWDELMEVVAKAKILEVDIAAWMSMKGRASLSLPWPKQPRQ